MFTCLTCTTTDAASRSLQAPPVPPTCPHIAQSRVEQGYSWGQYCWEILLVGAIHWFQGVLLVGGIHWCQGVLLVGGFHWCQGVLLVRDFHGVDQGVDQGVVSWYMRSFSKQEHFSGIMCPQRPIISCVATSVEKA